MIAVGGFNTAIDRLLFVDALRTGTVVRARRAQAAPGGKGLHVALTIAALGEPVTLVGLEDARHGSWLREFLGSRGVAFEGEIADTIRTCFAIHADDGTTTEVLEPGPELDAEAAFRLGGRFLVTARNSALGVLSGSLPRGMPQMTYATLIAELARARVPCLLDTSGEALRLGCAARPALVKPNRDEAGQLRGAAIRDHADAEAALTAVAALGPERVVLSLGREGALARWDGRTVRLHAPRITARNAVGSGDCLLGGLAVGLVRGYSTDDTLRLGIACGAANAQGEETGVIARADVERLLPQVVIEWLPSPSGSADDVA